MTIALAILGAISSLYGMWVLVDKYLTKSPAQKAIQVIAETEAAIEKSKQNDDTSDLEKLLNS